MRLKLCPMKNGNEGDSCETCPYEDDWLPCHTTNSVCVFRQSFFCYYSKGGFETLLYNYNEYNSWQLDTSNILNY
jgi:hypothetical protein